MRVPVFASIMAFYRNTGTQGTRCKADRYVRSDMILFFYGPLFL